MKEIELVKAAVRENRVPAVYLWHGDDRFLLREAVQALKEAFLAEDPSGSGIETVSGVELSPGDVVERANTGAFFGHRLLIVEDIPYFLDGPKIDLEPLDNYLLNPNPQTCLLLLAQQVHRGRKLYKEILGLGQVLEFSAPHPKKNADWQQWVQAEAKARGKQMSPAVARFFLDWAGHQSGILSQELDKLAVFAGERTVITEEDVRVVATRMPEGSVFDLLDAVAGGVQGQALPRLHEVLRQNMPLQVLAMIVRQVRLLLGAAVWRRQGGSAGELAAKLGIRSPYEAQKIWQQSLKLEETTLVKAMEACLATDIAIKTGQGDPALLLELLVIQICSAG